MSAKRKYDTGSAVQRNIIEGAISVTATVTEGKAAGFERLEEWQEGRFGLDTNH